ncbi:hypothetical protein ACFO5R_18925 [Halosolutus amylolyticus]|uniref:HTTM-like domain-containing protein n=1 Tax=Halosolutus amylolyticus TaxID=2932267 RepID=A0ABD5PVJ9_9EURY|nr:hypothetical protein [Halosolutus amylolyticus]
MVGLETGTYLSELGTNSALVIRVITVLIGALAIVTSLEHFATRDRFGDDGLLSWKITQLYIRTGRVLPPLMERVLQRPFFQGILVARVAIAVLLVALAVLGHVSVLLLGLLFATNVALTYRFLGGLTGTFQVSMITLPALAVAVWFPDGSVAQTAAIAFIAAQIVLSYFVAGVSKLVSREWQTGTALGSIFSTEMYGNGTVYRLLTRFPKLQFAGAWMVIGFETAFPVVLFGNDAVLTLVLGAGVLFHVFNAVFMGLNNFLIGFPATYPAIIYTNKLLHGILL